MHSEACGSLVACSLRNVSLTTRRRFATEMGCNRCTHVYAPLMAYLIDVAATQKTSRRRRRDCRRRRGDVPATSGRIGCHIWRRLRDVALVRAHSHFEWSPESPESPELPRLIIRGSRGDVSANEIGPFAPNMCSLWYASNRDVGCQHTPHLGC